MTSSPLGTLVVATPALVLDHRGILRRMAFVLVSSTCVLGCAINDGVIEEAPATLTSISGTIRYYNGAAPIDGVTVTLSGPSSQTTTTDENGSYSFSNLPSGSYSVTPSKSGGVTDAVTALDAQVIMRILVGFSSLSADQRI